MIATGSRSWFLAFAILFLPALAHADVVVEWHKVALASAVAARQNPVVVGRTLAVVHAAMFDAMNAIEAAHHPYKVRVAAPDGSSSDAAGAAAAHAVLSQLLPDQRASLDAAFAASLGQIADGAAKDNGIAIGEKVAAEMVTLRAGDGSNAPNVYRPIASPGVYVPTTMPLLPGWGNVTPWLMDRGSQFRPAEPPRLASAQWARDYNETKDLGGKNSTLRTAEQSDIARFWIVVGPASFSPIVQQLAVMPGRTPMQNARLFALVAMATADAYIAILDAKYHYNFWRPITAIRNGDLDGNDATVRDSGWEPLIDTPMIPEYPCAHCIISGTVGAVLQAEFGPTPLPSITMTSPTAPGITRNWSSIREYMDEVSAARIYGGIHYRTSNMVGQEMGRKIGNLAVDNYLKPVR